MTHLGPLSIRTPGIWYRMPALTTGCGGEGAFQASRRSDVGVWAACYGRRVRHTTWYPVQNARRHYGLWPWGGHSRPSEGVEGRGSGRCGPPLKRTGWILPRNPRAGPPSPRAAAVGGCVGGYWKEDMGEGGRRAAVGPAPCVVSLTGAVLRRGRGGTPVSATGTANGNRRPPATAFHHLRGVFPGVTVSAPPARRHSPTTSGSEDHNPSSPCWPRRPRSCRRLRLRFRCLGCASSRGRSTWPWTTVHLPLSQASTFSCSFATAT